MENYFNVMAASEPNNLFSLRYFIIKLYGYNSPVKIVFSYKENNLVKSSSHEK